MQDMLRTSEKKKRFAFSMPFYRIPVVAASVLLKAQKH